jgi:Asp-tRNA(Asn)/Glu-tRNA(Gln) amidotransferase A subunit family amidase
MKLKHDFTWLSATEIASLVRTRKASPVEVMQETLNRIENINPQIGAFVTMNEEALEQARHAEESLMKGKPLGALHGVPVAIKDLTPTKGIRTTMGSKLFEHHIPDTDAVIVQRLKAAGAIVVGKTNTPEFGYKGTTDNLLFPPTRNPWKLDRTPGGSSGGSAAAVAAGLVSIAEGGDGGGSIRIPGAFCGVFAFKPTYGRIPSDILNPFASTSPFLHFGSLARTVEDGALMYQLTAGDHEIDPYSLKNEENVMTTLHDGIRGLKIGYSSDLGFLPVDPEVKAVTEQTMDVFRALGCQVEHVDLGFENPEVNIKDSWNTLWKCLLTGNFIDLPDEMLELVEPQVKQFLLEGRQLTVTDFARANLAREMIWRKMNEFFARYDLLILPTTSVTAFSVDIDGPSEINGQAIDPLFGWFQTYPFNLTGHPAASVPCGFSKEGLPIGLQIVGQRFADSLVLRACSSFESIAPWGDQHPTFQA